MKKAPAFGHLPATGIVVTLFVWILGCASIGVSSNQERQPTINSILVPTFQCRDDIIAEAVRNVFIEVLVRHAEVQVVREGAADVQLSGTITVEEGSSAAAGLKARATSGRYVAGVTVVASRGSSIVTSASWGQTLGRGVFYSPEVVAKKAALQLLAALEDEGLATR